MNSEVKPRNLIWFTGKKRCISIAVVKKYTEVRLERDPIGCPFVGRKSHLDGKLLPSPIRVPTAVVFIVHATIKTAMG